eukprot:NODE_6747_length_486_cov_221.559165.p4 GENE.NODE_6747_length_486_cov_221.559165~~NODE_6747_length_486_cov_221.559165.p4  ORF type:complete len:81 (+),score=8.45 NODE_6747_length_486_cov_221.559165:188-430(+)
MFARASSRSSLAHLPRAQDVLQRATNTTCLLELRRKSPRLCVHSSPEQGMRTACARECRQPGVGGSGVSYHGGESPCTLR